MRKMGKWQSIAAAALGLAALQGCSGLGYLTQAASGQMSLMGKARPIEEWMARSDVDPSLKRRLERARQMRRFASEELGLPRNESYSSYADLGRPYALWNVVAAPELSLSAKTSCFPIAGCVSYRGYYDLKAAKAAAAELLREGFDVEVGGVAAYSTLGWFKDPLLSTFIHRPDPDLAGLIFHELAHQRLYKPGDTAFNESFATAVEEAGVELWLAREGESGAKAAALWRERQAREARFKELLMGARERLRALYESGESEQAKRSGKKEALERLKSDYALLKQEWGGYAGYDRWFASDPSNASLSSVGAYHDHVAAFRELMRQSASMRAFYDKAQALSELSQEERSIQLEALAGRARLRAQAPPAALAAEARQAPGGARLAGLAPPDKLK